MHRHELQEVIEHLHARYRSLTDGDVATYIPELAKSPPDDFGVSLVTSRGRVFETGDADRRHHVDQAAHVWHGHGGIRPGCVEPSGDTFNSIELQNGTNRPHNPMINAGAISVTALLHARFGQDTMDLLLDRLSAAAGRRLSIDQSVFESERRTGHRNRAIAHLLLNFGIVHDEAEDALDVYFKQCAIS